MNDQNTTGGTAVAEQPQQQTQTVTTNRRGPKPNSPTALQFALAWNHPEVKTRQDVIKRLNDQGFAMSYSALVNRAKSYTDPNRQGGPIKLKDLVEGQRGRRVDSTEINAALAQAAAQQQIVEGEGETEPEPEAEQQQQ